MRALEAEMVEEQKARVESLKLLKSLDAQIEEKQKIEQADFKQFLAEKRLIDEVIAKVRDVEECSLLPNCLAIAKIFQMVYNFSRYIN